MKKTLFFLFSALMNVLSVNAQTTYAVFTSEDKTLTFYYDENYVGSEGQYDIDGLAWWANPGWENDGTNKEVERVVFDASFKNARPTSTSRWFSYMQKLKSESIINLDYLNTSEVTHMAYMFNRCEALTSIDVSFFNTENVTNMSGMFNGCMALENINLSNFKTEKVTTMHFMFNGCNNLTEIDINSFNTGNVAYVQSMFSWCSQLKTIYVGNGWSTASVTSSGEMFKGCTALVGGKGTAYDANHVDYEYARIDGGEEQPGYFTYKPSRDLNDDGKVSTADIQVIINEMKGAQQSGTVSPEKDLNNDGKISTADIQVIINEMKK